GVDAGGVGDGVEATTVEGCRVQPGGLQALAGERVEVDAPVAGAGGDAGRGGACIVRDEGVADFLADLVGLRPGRGAEPGEHAAGGHAHGFDGGFEHAGGEAAPAGVGGGYDVAVGGAEGDGEAVGGEDGEDGVGGAGDGGVGFRVFRRRAPLIRPLRGHLLPAGGGQGRHGLPAGGEKGRRGGVGVDGGAVDLTEAAGGGRERGAFREQPAGGGGGGGRRAGARPP